MATHDYNIANQIGSEFRADLNNALLAIVSNNSNATSPSTTYAYQLWVDTANNVLKLRNSANNAWITTGISITASNSFTGDITGNSATATALATARTINGVSFDGTANISFNTDSVSEGSSNKYFTNERVDDQVNSLLTAGSGISLTYDDAAGTLTIANTNSADITSVVAGDGLTGGGTSGDVTLAVGVDDSSIEINSDALRVKASGVTNAMLAGSIANSKLANSSVTINSQAISLGGSHTFDSDDIGEGSSNLYFTNARARGSLSIGSEGSASGNGAIAYNSSTGVFTYTPPVISGLTGDTDDLSEGSSNLYYTDARSNAAIDARVTNTFINNLSGVVADTATALATARSIALSGDVTASGVNFDGTGDITLSTTIAANSVALGTDTTGNYVATIADAGNSRITVANSGSETAAVTLDIADDAIGTDQLANNAVALGTQSTGNYVATITGTTNEIEVSGSGSETASVTIGLPDNVTIAGNLTVNGTTTSVNTQTLEVEDPLIKLAKANSGADSVDIGFYGLYDTSGSQDLYAGLFRDASDSGKFKLFKDLQAEPTTTVNTSGTGYAVGTLVSNLEGDVTGTLQTAAQPNITSLGTLSALTVTGEITANGGIALGDSDKATFGVGDDLQIFHTGSSSVIADAGTGDLKIRANDLIIQSYSLEHNYIQADEGGEVRLYHNNSEKLNTTSSGVDVTGTLDASTQVLVGTNDSIFAENNIRFKSSGGAFIDHNTTGQNINFRVSNSSSLDTTPLIISSSGITVAGNIANSSGDLTLDISGDIILDAGGGDWKFKDDGTDIGLIANSSSDLIIQSMVSDKDMIFRGNDGGSTIVALTLDMSDAGKATFNAGATFGGDIALSTSSYPKITLNDETGVDRQYSIGTSNETFIIRNETGTTDVLAITNDNKVGIGTTSPASLLSLQGDAELLRLDGTANTTRTIFFRNTTAANPAQIHSDGSLKLRAEDSGTHMEFHTVDTERMRIDSSGNLGLGETSPDNKLHVNSGTGNIVAKFESTDAGSFINLVDNSSGTFGALIGAEGDDIVFSPNNVEAMRIDGTGVGIGTTSPSTPLHVNGTITFGDGHTIGDDSDDNLLIASSANENIIIDSADDIILDTGGDDIKLKVGGTDFGSISYSNSNLILNSAVSNGDIIFKGNDGGSTITALTLDISDAGKAIFNAGATLADYLIVSDGTRNNYFGTDGNGGLVGTSTDHYLRFITNNTERMRILSGGNVGINTTTAKEKLDVSGAGVFTGDHATGTNAYGAAQGVMIHASSSTGFVTAVSNGSNDVDLQLRGLNGGTANANQLVLDSEGGVGIGTASPSFNTGKGLEIERSGTATIRLQDSGNKSVELLQSTDFEIHCLNSASNVVINPTSNTIFETSSTERMRIDSSGNVGIGTSSPSQILNLQADTPFIQFNQTGTDSFAGINFGDSDDANDGQILYDHDTRYMRFQVANAERVRIDASGNVGIGETSPDNRLHINSGSDNINTKFESTDTEVRLQLKDSSGTSYIAARNDIRFGNDTSTERMRINSNGHILFGVTSLSTTGAYFESASNDRMVLSLGTSTTSSSTLAAFKNSNGTVGSIAVSGSATAFNTSSDARLKEVTGSARGLDVINDLNPVAYNWKVDGKADEGLIAQEVEELVPNAINQDEDGYYSMDYSKLVTHLVKGMQEQQEQIESLKSEIANLKGE